MRIKIRDIPELGLDWEATFDAGFLRDALGGSDVDLAGSRAFASLHLSRVGDNVFARGRLAGNLTVPCSRCLAPTAMLVDVPLRYTFAPDDLAPPDDDIADDVEFATHDGQHVVFDDILREALILTVPMTPLCREDCKGLCPVCGEDRNLVACDCSPHPPDPRLEALKNIKL